MKAHVNNSKTPLPPHHLSRRNASALCQLLRLLLTDPLPSDIIVFRGSEAPLVILVFGGDLGEGGFVSGFWFLLLSRCGIGFGCGFGVCAGGLFWIERKWLVEGLVIECEMRAGCGMLKTQIYKGLSGGEITGRGLSHLFC